MSEKPAWHLDRKVPVGIIITILFQAAGGLWFLSKLDSRLDVLEKQDTENVQVNKAFFALEANMKSTQASQIRIEKSLDKMNDRLNRLVEKDN
ncbi:MAG: hypothetical protein L3J65_11090 [Robiginitomaculum sp.]|nr:hypothetical protein [Robiginitomaculum sp.]